MPDEYRGVPCPVPNCEGYLKESGEGAQYPYVCEYGHIVEKVP